MAEFLHQVVKKREREQEMHTLQADIFRPIIGLGFTEPIRPMPPSNEIPYRCNPGPDITEHSFIFPNVGSWIQSAVVILASSTIAISNFDAMERIAWRLLAGHGCRPNYTYLGNGYQCRSCRATLETNGTEWRNG